MKPHARPRRTLGAWRRGIASPVGLLAALAAAPDVLTEATKDALALIARHTINRGWTDDPGFGVSGHDPRLWTHPRMTMAAA